MIELKLNFLNKIELFFLGIDRHKVSKWLRNRNVLNIKKEKILKKEWQNIKKEFEKIKVTRKNAEQMKKKLSLIEKKLKKTKRELNKGDITFDSFFKFSLFVFWFNINFFNSLGIKNIIHEREHAKVYLKNGKSVEYGWKKIFDEEREKYRYIPFISAEASKKIHLKALKNVRKKSSSDEFDIKLLDKRFKI